MTMNTYVNFASTCAEAFRFYEKHLGGTIGMMMTHGQAPDQSNVNPEWKDLVGCEDSAHRATRPRGNRT